MLENGVATPRALGTLAKSAGPVVGAKEVDLLRVGFPNQAVVMPGDGNLVDQAWQVGIVRVGC